jgi:hypothetical protein
MKPADGPSCRGQHRIAAHAAYPLDEPRREKTVAGDVDAVAGREAHVFGSLVAPAIEPQLTWPFAAAASTTVRAVVIGTSDSRGTSHAAPAGRSASLLNRS